MCTGFEADWSRTTISVTHYLVVWPKTSYLTLLIPVFSSVKWESVQSCFCDPMGCSPPVFSVNGIFQTRILEWVAVSYSRGSSRPRYWTCVSCIADRFFTCWAIGEVQLLCNFLLSHLISSRLSFFIKCEIFICMQAVLVSLEALSSPPTQ